MNNISVITVNKDNALGLEKTIKSVICQSYSNYEFIVIDGNSSDNSCEIINKYKDKIDYWVSEADNGVYHAMNKGIEIAKGEYCLFMNSGDYLNSENVLKEFSESGCIGDVISGNAFVDLGEKGTELVKSPEFLTFYRFFKHTILHQATFIKKSLFGRYGNYNTNIKFVADWEFFIKVLFMHNCTYQYLPLTVSVFDASGMSSMQANKTQIKRERENVFNLYFPLFFPDYKLIEDSSVYDFLVKIKGKKSLGKLVKLVLRVLNKVIPN